MFDQCNKNIEYYVATRGREPNHIVRPTIQIMGEEIVYESTNILLIITGSLYYLGYKSSNGKSEAMVVVLRLSRDKRQILHLFFPRYV